MITQTQAVNRASTCLAYATRYDCFQFNVPATAADWLAVWLAASTTTLAGSNRTLFHGRFPNRTFIDQFHANNLRLRKQTKLSIAITEELRPNLPPRSYFQQVEQVRLGEAFPYPDDSFDSFCCEGIPVLLSPEHRRLYIREIKRVMKPRGRISMCMGYLLGAGTHSEVTYLLSSPTPTPYLPDPVHLVDIKQLLEDLGATPPYSSCAFPGFDGFDEKRLLTNNDLIFDHWADKPGVPDVFRGISVVMIGLSAHLGSLS